MKSIIHYSLLVFTFAILAIGCINSGSEVKKTGLAPNVTDGPFTTIILTETHEVDLYRQRGLVSIVDLSDDTKQGLHGHFCRKQRHPYRFFVGWSDVDGKFAGGNV